VTPDHETERDRFTRLLFYAVVLLVAYLGYLVVLPFLGAIAWAAVFAMLFQPVLARLEPRVGRTRAALLTTLLVAFAIIGPLATVASILVREVPHLMSQLQASGITIPTPARVQEIWEGLRERVPFPLPEDLTGTVRTGISRAASFVAARAGTVLANVAGVVGQLFVVLFVLFFFLRDGEAIARAIRGLLPFEEARRERLVRQTHELVIASVGASFTIAVLQGLIAGLAFWLLGFSAPVFVGTLTAFFSFVPVVGASLVWVPAALWLLLSGDTVRALVLTGVGVGLISMVDNVVRPIMLSGRAAMSGLVIFIGLLGGISAFGFIGLVLGPVVLVAAATLLEAAAGQAPSPVREDAPSPPAPPDPAR